MSLLHRQTIKSLCLYYQTLKAFIALLEDGHSNVYYPDGLSAQYRNWPAIYAVEANKQAVVYQVAEQYINDIPLGSVIVEVDGIPTEQYLKEQVMPFVASSTKHILWHESVRSLLVGPPDSKVKIKYKTPDDQLKTLKIAKREKPVAN